MGRILTRRRLLPLAAASSVGVVLGRYFFGGPEEQISRGVNELIGALASTVGLVPGACPRVLRCQRR